MLTLLTYLLIKKKKKILTLLTYLNSSSSVMFSMTLTLQDEIHERDRYSDFMLAILRYLHN